MTSNPDKNLGQLSKLMENEYSEQYLRDFEGSEDLLNTSINDGDAE